MDSIQILVTHQKIICEGKLQFKIDLYKNNKKVKTINPNNYPIDIHVYTASNNEENPEDPCPMCLEDLNTKTVIECGHEFHEECLELWMNEDKDTCPICRERIPLYSINIPLSEFNFPL